jgi:glycosyltransferase involved in cell wall biosynthesis
MRKIYGKCKILLVPSLWNEGYGRVAHEAQISGIPVIASTRGGLPEAVGPGGLLLDPESPIENWVNALRSLWQNDDAYAKMSAVAKAYAERPEASFESHMNAWVTALQSAVNQQSSEHIKI